MRTTNREIRFLIKKHQLKLYEVAERCGYSKSRFYVLLGKELMDEEKRFVIDAIMELSREKKQVEVI